MKKKWIIAIGAAVLLLATVTGLAGCSGGTAAGGTLQLQGNLSGQQQGIWVNGEGKVTAVPDVAILSAGVEVQTATVADAQSQAAAAMDKVMAALKSSGVAAKDIQTTNFNIQKVTQWDNTRQIQVDMGYRVTNTVTAKIRDVSKAGAVIDAVAEAGGDLTRINSIGFTVDNPAPLQAQARQKAVADAAAKAQTLAQAAGVKLGKPVYITESSYIPTPIYRDVMTKAEGASAPAVTPVSPGEMDITIDVQIAYNME
jgi:uncharacterized protein